MYIFIYTHTYIHTYIHTHTEAHIHTRMHKIVTHTHTCTHFCRGLSTWQQHRFLIHALSKRTVRERSDTARYCTEYPPRVRCACQAVLYLARDCNSHVHCTWYDDTRTRDCNSHVRCTWYDDTRTRDCNSHVHCT
jgi:hypothetical protein